MSESRETQSRTNKNYLVRKQLLLALTAFFLMVALFFACYWLFVGRFYEETDNAYVTGNVIPITSQIAGTISSIKADNTQFVTTGQLLVELDPTDKITAFREAKARLANTLRTVQRFYINNSRYKANIVERTTLFDKARKDLLRRKQAIDSGAISQEELIHAQETFKSAMASVEQSQSALKANMALTLNIDLQNHPAVLMAAATLRQAYINCVRHCIYAPGSGEIAMRSAQIGQSIRSGTPLMALVPLDQVWVEANFKEKQVRHMHIGQPVKLTADLYGSSVIYHGIIEGFSAGTGSAFSLLPAQNATGNWIKVVQRLPVRIQLNPEELKTHPLRVGLSMEATVNTHNRKGPLIGSLLKDQIQLTTPIFNKAGAQADKILVQMIAENLQTLNSLITVESGSAIQAYNAKKGRYDRE